MRLNKKYIAVGRMGTGKTTLARQFAAASGLKICVVDTDDHPSYSDLELYNPANLDKWKKGNIRIITSDPEKVLLQLNRYCSNAFIIIEDAAKYITSNVGKDIKRFIIDTRKRNFDVVFMFHFLADVPPYLAKQYDHMLLFKVGDNLKTELKKFANWHVILEKAIRVNKHKSYNYCEKINIDE
jgi:hypothetical protein